MNNKLIIQNLGWDSEDARSVYERLHLYFEELNYMFNFENPIIVHLCQSFDDETVRSEYDEGVIILYRNTPDWRGDFTHELCHQMMRWEDVSITQKLKLEKKQKELEKNEGDGRIFIQKHTYSHPKEVLATFFKWYVLGKIVDGSYLEVLNAYQPDAIEVVEKILFNGDIQKSFSQLEVGAMIEVDGQPWRKYDQDDWRKIDEIKYEMIKSDLLIDDLIKKFIPTPFDKKTGKVDFTKVPIGHTVWITKEHRHIPITRYTDKKFGVDFQAARRAGYDYAPEHSKLEHLSFEITEKGNIKGGEEKVSQAIRKDREDKKPLSEKAELKLGIRKKLKGEKFEKKKQVIRELTDESKESKELDEIKNQVENKIKDFGLSEDAKKVYVNTVLREIKKQKNDDKIVDAFKVSKGEKVSTKEKALNLINPGKTKDEYELMSKIMDGFDEKGGKKVKFESGITKKDVDKEKLKGLVKEHIESIAKEKAFKKESSKATIEKLKEITSIGSPNLVVSDKEMEEAAELYDKTKNNSNSKSLFTVLGGYYQDGNSPLIQILADKASNRQLNALLSKYADITIPLEYQNEKSLIGSIGLPKTCQLLAIYMRNKMDNRQFNSFKNKITKYYLDNLEKIEENALNTAESLRKELSKIKEKISKGQVWDKAANYYITENLIDQRNAIGAAHGIMSATSEFISALGKAKKSDAVRVELSSNPQIAKDEYNKFTFYKDRQNTKLETKFDKNYMVIDSKSLDEFYFKENKVERDKITELNRIKNNKEGVLKGKYGETTNYTPPYFNSNIKMRPAQRNDINMLKANDGRGVIARTTGAGKTFIAFGFHCENLKKNPKYSTLMVVKDKNIGQQWDELKDNTKLVKDGKAILISPTTKGRLSLIRKANAEGKIIMISHSDAAKFAESLSKKNFSNITVDEPHELFFNKNGDFKEAGKVLMSKFKNVKHRVAMTATPVATSPSDIYNQIRFVAPETTGKSNFKKFFGDKENYKINGVKEIGQFTINDMLVDESNLTTQFYRDSIDRYVSADDKIAKKYDVNYSEKRLKILPEHNKQLLSEMKKDMSGLGAYLKKVPKWYKDSYSNWKERKKEEYVDNSIYKQMKLANVVGGEKNPKTKEFVGFVKENPNSKHVVYIDDKTHHESVVNALKKSGYPETQLYSMLSRDDNEQRKKWKDSDKPGIIFIDKRAAAGSNLQAGEFQHQLGIINNGVLKKQHDGRVARGDRDKDVGIIEYHFDRPYENAALRKVRKDIITLSSVDKTLQRKSVFLSKEKGSPK